MTTTAESMLVCRVRARLCAFPIAHVLETLRPLPMQPLADTPPFVSGVSLIRGEAVPVVDPGRLLGSEEPANPTRLLLLRAGQRRVACALEAVLGVRTVSTATLTELPPLLRQAHSDLVSALLTLDAELALVLRAARVLGDAAFGALERNEAEPRERNETAGGAQ